MGIKINSVISLYIIGSALAAVASFLFFSNYTTIAPSSGAMPGLRRSSPPSAVSGVNPSAVIGAFIIGICENLLKGMKLTAFSDAFTFALLHHHSRRQKYVVCSVKLTESLRWSIWKSLAQRS